MDNPTAIPPVASAPAPPSVPVGILNHIGAVFGRGLEDVYSLFHGATAREVVDAIPLDVRQELSGAIHTELPYTATSLVDLLVASGIPLPGILTKAFGALVAKAVLYVLDQVDAALLLPHLPATPVVPATAAPAKT